MFCLGEPCATIVACLHLFSLEIQSVHISAPSRCSPLKHDLSGLLLLPNLLLSLVCFWKSLQVPRKNKHIFTTPLARGPSASRQSAYHYSTSWHAWPSLGEDFKSVCLFGTRPHFKVPSTSCLEPVPPTGRTNLLLRFDTWAMEPPRCPWDSGLVWLNIRLRVGAWSPLIL